MAHHAVLAVLLVLGNAPASLLAKNHALPSGPMPGDPPPALPSGPMPGDPPPGPPGKPILDRGDLKKYLESYFNGWDRYGWMLINLLPVAMFALIRFRHVYIWRQKIEKLEVDYHKDIQKAPDPLFTLVNLMTPTLELDDYKFKGIKEPETRIDLRFENLGLELNDGRTVLAGVTGEFLAGRLVAIMGASGAGKTTFMNVLCGKGTYGKMSGNVLVNGEVQDITRLKSIMGFVPQEDTVHEKLTVRENIRFSASLRNPKGTKHSVLHNIVNDVLTVLQIGHIQMSIVGGVEERGISGGQRKRVNIGLELAATPTLLFLDEPTTGLDSTSSLSIVSSLKKMSELGMTIIMVIHQPRYSLFTLFDTVLLLGKGGKTCYLGEPWNAADYFVGLGFPMPEDDNPADWLMDVLSGEVKNEKEPDNKMPLSKLFQLWEEHSEKTKGEHSEKKYMNRKQTMTQGIASAFEEAWANCEVGVAMDRDELARLVKYCTGVRHPGGEIVEQLWVHIKSICGEEKIEFSFAEVVDSLEELRVRHLTAEGTPASPREEDGLSPMIDRVCEAVDNLAATPQEAVSKVMGHIGEASPRKLPSYFLQYRFLSQRLLVQLFRNMTRRILDISVITLAALVLGIQNRGDSRKKQDPTCIILVHLALSILIPVNCLSCLGSARTMFWRERSHGLLGISHCFSCMIINSIDVLLQTLCYVTVFYLAADPALPFVYHLEAMLCLSFVCSGWGYLISCLVPPSSATLAVAVLMLILNGCFGDPSRARHYIDGGFMEFVVWFCPTRWTLQMTLLCWFEAFNIDPAQVGLVGQVNTYRKSAFDKGQEVNDATTVSDIGNAYWSSAVTMLCLQAVILRLLTIPILCYRNRDKQV